MEVHAADGPVVLVEAVEQRAHPVVPELDDAVVQRGEDPGPHRVEGEALHPVRLGLELGQHGSGGHAWAVLASSRSGECGVLGDARGWYEPRLPPPQLSSPNNNDNPAGRACCPCASSPPPPPVLWDGVVEWGGAQRELFVGSVVPTNQGVKG